MVRMASVRLRTINNWLTTVVVLLALYIIAMPLAPAVSWWAKHEAPLVSAPAHISVPKPHTPAAPTENTLIIPNLGLSEAIHEGASVHTLHFGVWHLPGTSSPDKGSNTVLAGHRYTYSGSGVFYHLDKVKVGDDLTLYWQQKRYDYSVVKVAVVPPSEMSVQAPTNDARLTIYTCTPMWTFKNRLVVEAKLETAS
jgi:sortase A